jgi:4-amino-4-deoxy-L-arabinose transferase-like glycosyltransferase
MGRILPTEPFARVVIARMLADRDAGVRTPPRYPGSIVTATGSNPPSRRLVSLAVIVGLAGAVRVICWLRTAAIFNDGPTYIELAQQLQAGLLAEVIAHPYHPLFPAAVAAAHFVAGDWEWAAVTVSIVSGCGSVVLLHRFVCDAFDRRTADIAALILAVHPWAVRHSSDVQSDGLYLVAFLAAVAVLWRAWREQRAALAFAAGALSGLAYWVRPEGIGVALIGIALALACCCRRSWSVAPSALWSSALASGALLVVAPLVVAVGIQTGHWVLTQKKPTQVFLGLRDRAAIERAVSPSVDPPSPNRQTETRIELPPRSGSPRRPIATPGSPPTSGHRAAILALLDRIFTTYRLDLLIFLGFGLAALRGRPGPRAWFVLAFVVSYGIVFETLHRNAGYLSRRHVLPPLTLTIGYAASGVIPAARWIITTARRMRGWRTPPPRRAQFWAACVGLGIVLLCALPMDFARRRDNRVAVRSAAGWLKEQTHSVGPIGARRLRVAYYAGAPFVPLPERASEPLVAYLRERGVHYLVIDDEHASEYPELRDPGRFGLQVIHRVHALGRSAAVFAMPESVPADPLLRDQVD